MKALQTSIETEIDAQNKRPRLLYEIELDGLTLRYIGDKNNINFPSGSTVTYIAKAVGFSGFQQTIEGQVGRVSINFDNTSKDMGAYISAYDWEGRVFTIKRIYLDSAGTVLSGTTAYNEIFKGIFDPPKSVNRNWLEISATIGKPLKRQALLGIYQRDCRHTFGDSNSCNVDSLADLTSLIITAAGVSFGSATTINNTVNFSQTTDYWNYGKVLIGYNGTTYTRKVLDYNYSAEGGTGTITFDVTMPVSITSDYIFTVVKGCNKRWATCGSSYAYGPSGDNSLNFGGFQHIGTIRD